MLCVLHVRVFVRLSATINYPKSRIATFAMGWRHAQLTPIIEARDGVERWILGKKFEMYESIFSCHGHRLFF